MITKLASNCTVIYAPNTESTTKFMNMLRGRTNIYPLGMNNDQEMLNYYLDHPETIFAGLSFNGNEMDDITIHMNNTHFNAFINNPYNNFYFLSMQKNLQLTFLDYNEQNVSDLSFSFKKFPKRQSQEGANCKFFFFFYPF